jgi:hypothetical protein
MRTPTRTLRFFIAGASALALAASGSAQWARINGPANGNDHGSAITTDVGENVIAVGSVTASGGNINQVVSKFDSAGNPLWTRYYDGPDHLLDTAVTVDTASDSTVWVAGISAKTATGQDITTFKYDSAGNLLWSKRYNGTSGAFDDQPVAIKSDGLGGVYVAGWSVDLNGVKDFVTLHYTTSGALFWKAQLSSPGVDDAIPVAMAVDLAGNVVVTGSSGGRGWGRDFLTVKYSYTGDKLWSRIYNGAGKRNDIPCSVAFDSTGNVVVGGSSIGRILDPDPDSDFLVVKYSSGGLIQWISRLDTGLIEEAQSMALGADDSVVLTGIRKVGGAEGDDILVVKYGSDGAHHWHHSFSGLTGSGSDDSTNGVVVDAAGNVIIGCTLDEPTQHQMAYLSYNSSGGSMAVQRTLVIPSTGYGTCRASDGTIYSIGDSLGLNGEDIVITKF